MVSLAVNRWRYLIIKVKSFLPSNKRYLIIILKYSFILKFNFVHFLSSSFTHFIHIFDTERFCSGNDRCQLDTSETLNNKLVLNFRMRLVK